MKLFAMRPAMGFLATGCIVLSAVSSSAQPFPPSPKPPLMTIKIFNDDPNNYIFPVLTMGTGADDVWMQAFFKTPKNNILQKNWKYPRSLPGATRVYRIYINPIKGIPPKGGIELTLPLFTQFAEPIDPTKPNQFIDWWQGGNLQLYSNKTATTPKALKEALDRRLRPSQQVAPPFASAPQVVRPTCVGRTSKACPTCPAPLCEPLVFYSDTDNLPNRDPNQLVEYTLGARQDLEPVANPNTDPPNALDVQNVDFDVSYVNHAALPATMGPYKNDQVGYVGTKLTVNVTQDRLKAFRTSGAGKDWPFFLRKYSDGTTEPMLKLPAPLEVFQQLSGGGSAPTDFNPPPSWPNQLWPPIQALRANWLKYGGTVNANGQCVATPGKNSFCDAIVEAKKLMKANYANYLTLFKSGGGCSGTPVALTDARLLAHVYGWTPFTEVAKAGPGLGCGAKANLLEDTPGYWTLNPNKTRNYAEYQRVKTLFDKLNYGALIKDKPLTDLKYVFNPWVQLIHGNLEAPNAYAYSVDDAVGNIQADGLGFIVDIGSTINLENQNLASAPITVALGFALTDRIRFTHYRLCSNVPGRDKKINPRNPTFIINANNPQNCPIFLYDNKAPEQLYTFKVTRKPPFKFIANPAVTPAIWTSETAAPIDCTGNTGAAPFKPSSRTWCCQKLAVGGTGVFAYSSPEPHNAHRSMNHWVITNPAKPSTTLDGTVCQ